MSVLKSAPLLLQIQVHVKYELPVEKWNQGTVLLKHLRKLSSYAIMSYCNNF